MQLTIRLKQRWITSVLGEAKFNTVAMPWHRGTRRNLSIVRRSGMSAAHRTGRS